ncbi:MAG: D-alanyl-D-alanine carboxypeptidase [Bacteroidetes bacterium]|nr:D-alanyl-D-alanine carboxypeptidase [Bacteroidota bacterium]MBI3482626.1 D-alanyl-D-alanine carboxypeptidase [Bacteroidota bacterium]
MRSAFVLFFFLVGCSARFIKKEIKETENQLHEHVGFYLYDLAKKKVKVDYNGSKYFTPASNTKIFTFYTSLRLLSDSVSSLKYIKRGDSLIFQGMGDPSFFYKNVFDNERAFRFLKEHQGKLFFSSDNFQTQSFGAGWAWDDYNDYYSAERSPFPVYGNLISIRKYVEEVLIFRPALFEYDFVKSDAEHPAEEIIRDYNSNRLVYFNGKKKSKEWTIPFLSSDSLTLRLLSDTLHREVNQILWPKLDSAKILKSIPTDSLYRVMMQDSDNFIAEQLLLQCAAIVSDTLKPEIAIKYSLENFLSDLPDEPQWVDGSGLSRYNLFTPRSIVSLWRKTYETVPQDRLFKLLAIGGMNGTLKNYYKSDVPFVFGKTGSLGNNHSLSGFLITRKGKIFIFSFMNNNFIVPGIEVRKRMEKIINRIREKY